MGFFNAMTSIGEINRLIKDFENQVTITQGQVQDDASMVTLNNSLNVLKSIHQELIYKFSNSSGARVAMYKMFGKKMQMDELLTYTKNVIYNLNAIINN